MSQTSTVTNSHTYSTVDVGNVFRRFRADILMIADSSGALLRSKAEEYAHDAEYLAAKGYLKKVDLTLLVGDVEHRAVQYFPNESSGDIESSRPGGVIWPKLARARVRIVLFYTSAYTDAIKQQTQKYLKIGWVTSHDNTTHDSLSSNGGRDYTSGVYGLKRKDFQ